jgi:hypothetical protein
MDAPYYQFQIKDEIKAARTEATRAYNQYALELTPPANDNLLCKSDREGAPKGLAAGQVKIAP